VIETLTHAVLGFIEKFAEFVQVKILPNEARMKQA